MAKLLLKGLWKTYSGSIEAVRNVNLTVADGEFVVLVGPSGCGKSTTLRMVAGLEDITAGELSIAGRVVNEVAPKDRDIAMVFQNYALYPHMTVRKNLAFGLERKKTPREEIERRIADAATMLGLSDLLERKPGALSGGQRQRVALGRAIVREPAAFLFDEPLSNLDAKLRVEMRAELKSLHKRLCSTVLYVTHDQEEAMTLGDRLVVMDDGVVQQVGPPSEIYDKPANRFVAGFVGTPPMNFLNADSVSRVTPPEAGLCLGVRPSALQLVHSEDRAAVTATLVASDNLGDCSDLLLQTATGEKITCRAPGRPEIRAGDTVFLSVNPEDCHFFRQGPHGARVG
ncbi:MAG: sn-glycerol-3-phosphate ABC transporter ATP-binding protein UgpC [Planctomycetota bacterium]|jgi:ABC-type sugar transport system ATPase subunit|nr:sn-glycerol-3-phosphate ABC transporter ATP-binding protein UgpC [Planctomycetota bacterium]MDP6940903.1 sn-glycerol-3-phosphate ABC transporter ATP-binding protein UgpC [Planctomycetota bacterium]